MKEKTLKIDKAIVDTIDEKVDAICLTFHGMMLAVNGIDDLIDIGLAKQQDKLHLKNAANLMKDKADRFFKAINLEYGNDEATNQTMKNLITVKKILLNASKMTQSQLFALGKFQQSLLQGNLDGIKGYVKSCNEEFKTLTTANEPTI